MSCEEFKIRYHRCLDQHASDENLEDHLRACEACRDYVREINNVVSEIHAIKRLPVPGSLLQEIRSIPIHHRRKREAVLRQSIIGLAGVIIYFLGTYAVPATEFIIEVGLLILAFTLTAINLLKRALLNP